MSLVFATYTSSVYQEINLPMIDNANYELLLKAKDYGLTNDLRLQMEVVSGDWSFKRSATYQIFRNGNSFEEQSIHPGMILQIQPTKADRAAKIVILVWNSSSEIAPYRKYRVVGSQISIGRSEENDICYTAHNIIGRCHAQIVYQNKRVLLRNQGKNGTYVDNHRVDQEQELHFGDRITLFGLTVLYLGEILAVSWLEGDVKIKEENLVKVEGLEIDEKTRANQSHYEAEQIVHISPRTIPELFDEEESIENVPQKKEGDKRPMWMNILPPLTMVLPMIVGYSLMSKGNMGMGIVISLGSAIVGVTWAIVNVRYAKKKEREDEKVRLERYERYLVQCADRIREKYEFNQKSLREMYPDALTCSGYTAQSAEIWSRKPTHSDLLYVRLGLGEMPFQVKITVPKQGFTLTDDELTERPEKIAERYEVLNDVPVGVALKDYNVVGILTGSDKRAALDLVRVMIAQIAANHSYTDVKLCVLYDGSKDTAEQWGYVRWLPHVWNEERSMRYVADDQSGINDVLYSLAQVLRARLEQSSGNFGSKPEFLPKYVLIVESPAMLESQVITKYLYENGASLGITTVMLADTYESLPSACDFVVEQSESFSGTYGTKENSPQRQDVKYDEISQEQMDGMARRMSSMRVNQVESSTDIPDSVTFFEMMKIHKLEELNVLDHWRKNRTYESMRALVGLKVGAQDCYLDINEKYHGPHGLVAGTTGSGKSETLQTYILSLAVNFSPLDVGFFIIDFKGGGMANLFSNLPHTIGEISNLSGNQVRRAMVSIKSENMRRQRIFGEYGVNHIDAYTKLVKNKEANIPIPHLLIIIDEFAELKREEPEFMRELISVAQVGRSLGVHLILATQKPSGTVDDNIWSNTKFKLCLRVADKQDSNDMLHKPDAAYLTQAGRCYLQVGNDEIYELFQSGWSGATYDPSGMGDQSRAILLDLQGRAGAPSGRIRSERKRRQTLSWMTQVVKFIQQAAAEMDVKTVSQIGRDECGELAKRVIGWLNENNDNSYPETAANQRRIESVIQLWPAGVTNAEDIAEQVIERASRSGVKLPEMKEKTQLEAVVGYLAEMAAHNGFVNEQMLWMPVLPQNLYLSQLPGYQESVYQNGAWPAHPQNFQLSSFIGLVDDPENQMQFPLELDFARKGHLCVVGGVTSGKSTFLQTMLFGLVSRYSPDELNLYIVDFSSLMLYAFENDPHVGGIVCEGEDDRLNKLFGLMGEMLKQRKQQIKGGSFSQYVQMNGHTIPTVMLVIDGYANFREKTEDRFENILLELSRTAEGYGIYLVISCAGYGSSELQSKIADNMRQSICLELGDKYRYGEALRTLHFDVMPEENVKGRGLVSLDGNVLEYQTALACEAENDYARSERIKDQCASMSATWTGKHASPIPSIPEKPTWEIFSALDEYQKRVEEGKMLPVAYFQENASLYCVELSKNFCYLVAGEKRSGKSTFMRNLGCAARDVGGKLFFIDRSDGADQNTAQVIGAQYASKPEELFEAVKTLIYLTNERAGKRKELQQRGLEDEGLYQEISAQFQPVFFFIADFADFLKQIYTKLENIGKLNGWVENIFLKGQQLNVFFFAAIGVDELPLQIDKPAFNSFIHEHRGILLGSELGRQNVFSYQNISYSEQLKRLKVGRGYATNQDDDQMVDLVVVPNNRGHKQK